MGPWDAYPAKFIASSSSVLLVRESKLKLGEFEILLLKRSPKISFANYYAFPGGKIEDQDNSDLWKDKVPSIFKK